jgi:hypothetical protein
MMSTIQEIEAVIPKLTREQVEELRQWIDDYLENQLELTDGQGQAGPISSRDCGRRIF